jgi:hypothetical protein
MSMCLLQWAHQLTPLVMSEIGADTVSRMIG